jgi:FkbM family methyltransferase
MSWRTNSFIVAARGAGRALGLNDWIACRFGKAGYESAYDTALVEAIRPGDVVWDVGANVGYYTKRLADKVGGHGAVIAYEPSPHNFRLLEQACGRLQNVMLLQYGLAQADGRLRLEQGRDDLGATSRIVPTNEPGVEITVRSGISLIQSGVRSPSAIKIDVEGYELEVLEGLGHVLELDELRVVGVEVHFGILKDRSLPTAPRQIESRLQRSGFRVAWPDRSHLLALRPS